MKSRINFPSQYRPEGLSKNVTPLGGGSRRKAADRPPVSEFESPKLKIAGKLQRPPETGLDGPKLPGLLVAENATIKRATNAAPSKKTLGEKLGRHHQMRPALLGSIATGFPPSANLTRPI
ncbi:hypothetical protein SAY86_002403 [Trapa natans]|uniref:Uncharacterized protein n=1 Tax=Trapa natans TaxID=22666 RepID=A0AAN7LK63_TRANT|nr:hypothetical protein SAY86_002403 [Trapa natans]